MTDPYGDVPFDLNEPESPAWAGHPMPSENEPASPAAPAAAPAPAAQTTPPPQEPAGEEIPLEPADVNKVAVDVIKLLARADTHEEILTNLVTELEKLIKKPPHSQPSPWLWAASKGAARTKLWNEVSGFVDVYNARFGIYETLAILPCWHLHPVVVEEVTALMLSWRSSHYGHKVPTIDPNYWLQHFLYPTITRIRTEPWGQDRCATNFHEDMAKTSAPHRDMEAFAAHVEKEVAEHTPEPDPSPAE